MELLVGVIIKIISLFLRGEAKVEFKSTGKVLHPDADRRSLAIEYLRVRYRDQNDNRPAVSASNFKRDD